MLSAWTRCTVSGSHNQASTAATIVMIGGGPDRRGVADTREQTAQAWPDDEAEAERGAKEAERPRAILVGRDVADVGARRGDVAARQTVDDARGEQHRQAVRERQHREADHGAEQAEDQNRPAAPAVRPVAEQRRRDQLTERERREEQTDGERRRAERLARRTAAAG